MIDDDGPNPPDTMLPVWRDRYARGWPASDEGLATMTELWDLLSREYDTDAHHAAYQSPQPHRLTIDAATQVPVSMVLLVVDVDGPDHAATPAWRGELRARAASLPGNPCGYWTRGGARLLWRIQPRPVDGWSRWYVAQLLDLHARHGILADPACRDWPHLFRVPHGMRDGERQAHGWVCGVPEAIGTWPEATASDSDRLRTAVALAAQHAGWRAAVADLLPPVQGAQEAPRARPPGSRPPTGERAIAYAVQRVLEAGQGARNRVLYAQCAWMAELAAKGEVNAADARRELGEAAAQIGLPAAEVRGVMRSAKL